MFREKVVEVRGILKLDANGCEEERREGGRRQKQRQCFRLVIDCDLEVMVSFPVVDIEWWFSGGVKLQCHGV